MKKPAEREFVVEVGQSALLGVSPESMLAIKLISNRTGKDTMTYSASVEWISQHWLANINGRIPAAASANLAGDFHIERGAEKVPQGASRRRTMNDDPSQPCYETIKN